jgi:hypothetical protein
MCKAQQQCTKSVPNIKSNLLQSINIASQVEISVASLSAWHLIQTLWMPHSPRDFLYEDKDARRKGLHAILRADENRRIVIVKNWNPVKDLFGFSVYSRRNKSQVPLPVISGTGCG